MTRRRFGAMTLGAGFGLAVPRLGLAAETTGKDVDIKTSAGTADAFFVHPAKGRHPGVLVWPDIFGLRPAFKDMATRLAGAGYAVLVVNPFYRAKRAPTSSAKADLKDPKVRESLMALRNALTAETTQVDAKAFTGFIDAQAATDTGRKLGTSGYCMGGSLVLYTAAALPERIGAGACFHGGMPTDQPDSAHLLIPKMKAGFLVAIAANDDEKTPAAKDTLRAAFARAGLPAEIEVYAGTQHGWCPTDSPVYHHDQAEKAWGRMLGLFERSLA